jgi:nucleotide-binding universal stress UspA family protein
MSDEERLEGPIILGVEWNFSEHLVRTAASLAASLKEHLICAFVDPASYLTEWAPVHQRTALSLDPTINEEAEFPSEQLQQKLEAILGRPGQTWSFRVLNGDVCKALSRLADNASASLLVVGAGGPGSLAWMDRILEGSVSATLIHHQQRPVLIVPDPRKQAR